MASVLEQYAVDIEDGQRKLTAALNSDNAIEVMHTALRRYRKDITRANTNVIEREKSIRKLLSNARDIGGPDLVRHIINTDLQRVIDLVSNSIDLVKPEISFSGEVKEKISLIQVLRPDLYAEISTVRDVYRQTAVERRQWLTEQYYRLIAIGADYDPDAEGGEAFNNADDLIASLGR